MGADAESSAASPRHRIPEKREPVSDIDIAVADSLKVLDLNGRLEKPTCRPPAHTSARGPSADIVAAYSIPPVRLPATGSVDAQLLTTANQ
jgi:hypothetical protein